MSASLNLDCFYAVKAGMTRVFDKDGNHIPVTVVKLISNKVSQVKTTEKDGYSAYQLAFYEKRESLINKPTLGHLKKAGVPEAMARFAEVRLSEEADSSLVGALISYENFQSATSIDVTGTSKGKGFQGVMKRYNFAGGPAAHGSHFHRRPGSIGNRATPARVFKNKKLPGHMGDRTVTVQNLEVFEVNLEKGYLLIKGSVPGSKNGIIQIMKSVKK